MNRINKLFAEKPNNICSIYITAGYPTLESTVEKVLELDRMGIDMVEIGMPFSDPLADGETIQEASMVALENGMHLQLLFEQIREIRDQSEIPIVLMGYVNPVLRYGLEDFLKSCKAVGVDGLIIPDISLEEYELNFKSIFKKYNVPLTFLVTPDTSLNRLLKIKTETCTFIYYVSSTSTTGKTGEYTTAQIEKFREFKSLNIDIPVLMGFGIHNHQNFTTACKYFNGGIIGSAYLRNISVSCDQTQFLQEIKSGI